MSVPFAPICTGVYTQFTFGMDTVVHARVRTAVEAEPLPLDMGETQGPHAAGSADIYELGETYAPLLSPEARALYEGHARARDCSESTAPPGVAVETPKLWLGSTLALANSKLSCMSNVRNVSQARKSQRCATLTPCTIYLRSTEAAILI